MRTTTNFAANDATGKFIGQARRSVGLEAFEATIFTTGTFGSGTVQILASPDGGTTKVVLRDTGGNQVSMTAADVYNIRLGNGNKLGDAINLYATLTGATSPNINIDVYDNR